MMAGHASEDVIEHDHCVVDVRSFVEHDTLGSLTHRGVGDFGSRRVAGASKLVKDLGGPDDRDVRGFTQPEDLFLHLGEAFVASFDGEVSPGDHDPDESGRASCRERV